MCFVFCVLSLWVSVHDHNDHDEEANVGYEDQYHRSNDGPDEPRLRIQVTAAKNVVQYKWLHTSTRWYTHASLYP